MQLFLSSHNPLNATYSNQEGDPIYKITTPFGLTRHSTICRVLPQDVPRRADTLNSTREDGTTDPEPEPENRLQNGRRWFQIASVEHHTFKTSVIHYAGQEIKTKSYFHKVGFGWHGSHRAFTGPDGKNYKWLMLATTSKLVLDDTAETPVAHFHKRDLGIISRKPHPADLEIFQEGLDIMDFILVSFIWIEKMRQDRQDNSQYVRGPTKDQ